MEAGEAADARGWDVIFYGDSIMEEWRQDFPPDVPIHVLVELAAPSLIALLGAISKQACTAPLHALSHARL